MTKKKTQGIAYEYNPMIPDIFAQNRDWEVHPGGEAVVGSGLSDDPNFVQVEGGITYVLYEGRMVDISTLDKDTAKALRALYGI